jgi:Dehydrogenases with different specificities (related to short-chain alcohol dehydrogenases)
MRKLEGKTAVITGCSRGIGMEIMKLFVSQGANIIACSRCKNSETEKNIMNYQPYLVFL